MQVCRKTLLGIAAVAVLAAGCDDAGKKPLQARVPALQPASVTATNPSPRPAQQTLAAATKLETLPPLPLWSRANHVPGALLTTVPDSKSLLMAKVEEKFDSGEQNFKAGHLDAARRDFNEAVDWMLESGYDLNGDPKLSEVFHRIVDTVYTYELQAFRAGDGFQEPEISDGELVGQSLGRCMRVRGILLRRSHSERWRVARAQLDQRPRQGTGPPLDRNRRRPNAHLRHAHALGTVGDGLPGQPRRSGLRQTPPDPDRGRHRTRHEESRACPDWLDGDE
jgi:hypothetical protein